MKISTKSLPTTYSAHSIPVGGAGEMRVHVCRPEAPGERPGLLLFQEAFGVNDHILSVGRRLASRGFTVFAPELFHRSAPPNFVGSYADFPAVMPHLNALTIDGLSADLRATFDDLLATGGVARDRVGAIGFCMGGKAAFLANQILPLAASVSFYGGGIAADLLGDVGRMHAPQMLLWGGRDTHIPVAQTRAVEDALRAAGKDFVNVTFGAADHGFFCEARAQYDAGSARLAWPLAVGFLEGALARA